MASAASSKDDVLDFPPPRRTELTAHSKRLLFAEAQLGVIECALEALKRTGFDVVWVASLGRARAELSKSVFEVVVIDKNLPDGNGLDLLRDLSNDPSAPQVVVIANEAAISDAVEAIRLGAADYLVKPFRTEDLIEKLDRAFESVTTKRKAAVSDSATQHRGSYYPLNEGSSERIREVFRLIGLYAEAAPTPVLIQGETGVGKERAARSLHAASPRAQMPFVALNCATFDTPLFESELFGHERGAFTGAQERKLGLLELANGGTLFLDEIGDMPLGAQAKLLRAIESRTFRRVGGTREIHSDFWLICATNQNFETLIQANKFRSDLYYRLATLVLKVPPLRERLEDIPGLIAHICGELIGKHSQKVTFDDDVLEAFESYSWPGNIRELRNVIERALIVNKNFCITIPPGFNSPIRERYDIAAEPLRIQRPLQQQIEPKILATALRANGGNKAATARDLGIPVTTLKRYLKKFDIH